MENGADGMPAGVRRVVRRSPCLTGTILHYHIQNHDGSQSGFAIYHLFCLTIADSMAIIRTRNICDLHVGRILPLGESSGVCFLGGVLGRLI